MGRARARSTVVGLLLVLACVTGCGTTHAHLTVTPTRALDDTPLRMSLTGTGGKSVTLRLDSDDASGRRWQASQRVEAHGGTTVVDGRRLLSTMKPDGGGQRSFQPPRHWTMRVSVLDGKSLLARRTVVRLQPVEDRLVTEQKLRPGRGGLYGDLFEPVHPAAGAVSSVVVLGGSEGGLFTDDVAATLAARGHPALALAYFAEPGLPKALERVPLEYVARAVHRLGRAPHADPHRVFLFGDSRGSEAAMLTAIDFPGLVHGVVAGVPNAVAAGGLPDHAQPAWTFRGRGVPTSHLFGDPDAPDNPAAALDVSRFPGPLLLDCGGQDQIWPSCTNALALAKRAPGRTTVLTYVDGGHDVGSMLPGAPYTITGGKTAAGVQVSFGGTPAASTEARWRAWPRLLHFLGS